MQDTSRWLRCLADMSQVQRGNSTTTTSSRRYPALATMAGLAVSMCQQVSCTRSRAILTCTVAGVTVGALSCFRASGRGPEVDGELLQPQHLGLPVTWTTNMSRKTDAVGLC